MVHGFSSLPVRRVFSTASIGALAMVFVSLPSAAGRVEFEATFESGSAWIGNPAAQEMVERVFSEFERNLETPGAWNAVIEVYLTDDNPGTAHTFIGSYGDTIVDGFAVRAPNAWLQINDGILDPNGDILPDGANYDISVNFNVAGHADNDGLLRHELMHGLGSVAFIDWPRMTQSNVVEKPGVGTEIAVSVFDLNLVDLNGAPLLGAYNATTGEFRLNDYAIESTYSSWTDGDAGISFVGEADDGGAVEFQLGTGPDGNDALLFLNEPSDVMFASSRPPGEWDIVNDADRAFLRAMKYRVVPEPSGAAALAAGVTMMVLVHRTRRSDSREGNRRPAHVGA